MRYRMMFAVGVAVGYVLGSRAGRERYEQIKRAARRVADSPRVQEAAGLMGAQVSKVAGVARAKVGDTLVDRVPFLRSGREVDHLDTGTGWPESGQAGAKKKDEAQADDTGVPY
ncbi:YtxH domain-containing protein [Nonomuraea sp. NPDC059194]|uniref:YtxH domain-containing protein n=1 Tax=Nonomuraea sp. NPDC059194 TaxID=3346764 RepID=UPI0036805198